MKTLPNGVVLRDFYSPRETREEIFSRVQNAYAYRFPMENDRVRIELDDIGYDEKKKSFSLSDYQNALLTGGRLATPLKGRVRLLEKRTNLPLDEKEVVLANVPWLTDDNVFVMGGNQYVVNSQARLKAGVYARTKDNGELESHINVKAGTGPSMRVFMEPESGVFRVSVDKSNIKLYPILAALGVKDDQLREAWGDEILTRNQQAWDRRAFNKFYDKLLKHRANPDAPDEEKAKQIMERVTAAKLDPEVTTRTLGRPHEALSLDTFVDASRKLLRINRGEEDEDDRDNPASRTIHSVGDFLEDRVELDTDKLGRQLLYRATYDRSLKQLRPGYFTPQLEGLVVSNQLSQLISGINPVEYYDQAKRVIQIGEGALGSYDAIPLSARNLHAGHLGMIDPIRSSESRSIGVDQRFTIGAMKGSDNHVYFPVRNRRTNEIEYLNSTQLVGKTLGFGKPMSLAKFRTPIPTLNPTLNASIQTPSSAEALISQPAQTTPNATPPATLEPPTNMMGATKSAKLADLNKPQSAADLLQ